MPGEVGAGHRVVVQSVRRPGDAPGPGPGDLRPPPARVAGQPGHGFFAAAVHGDVVTVPAAEQHNVRVRLRAGLCGGARAGARLPARLIRHAQQYVGSRVLVHLSP